MMFLHLKKKRNITEDRIRRSELVLFPTKPYVAGTQKNRLTETKTDVIT